jgi:hypothetical protein
MPNFRWAERGKVERVARELLDAAKADPELLAREVSVESASTRTEPVQHWPEKVDALS